MYLIVFSLKQITVISANDDSPNNVVVSKDCEDVSDILYTDNAAGFNFTLYPNPVRDQMISKIDYRIQNVTM